jgi:hypothetical protein
LSDDAAPTGIGVGVPVGDIRFYEAIVPPLEDGDYELTATQTLTDLPGAERSPTIPPVKLSFSVRGPRFGLNPADVFSVFPPSGVATPYAGQLAHVVVRRKTLPWERLLDGVGKDQQKVTPWVGLLTFDEDDDGGIPLVQSGTVADLLAPGAAVAGGRLPVDTRGPTITRLDSGELPTDLCRYIDIPADLFAAVSPRVADLPFLAHAREVHTGDKPIEGIIADGVYSVLIGNRVVHASAQNAAFLVSFDGLADLLTGTAPTNVDKVRVVVLYSWSFRMGDTDPFDALMSPDRAGPLAVRSADLSDRAPQPIKPPVAGTDSYVADTVDYALRSGFAALPHALRDGGETFSWYRGPLIPELLTMALEEGRSTYPVFRTADQLLRYDPVSGLFDTSYAAAFALGRLLAMQNEAFLNALRVYVHQVKGQALRLAARKALAAAAPSLDLSRTDGRPARRGVVDDAMAHWLATAGADTLKALSSRGSDDDRHRS